MAAVEQAMRTEMNDAIPAQLITHRQLAVSTKVERFQIRLLRRQRNNGFCFVAAEKQAFQLDTTIAASHAAECTFERCCGSCRDSLHMILCSPRTLVRSKTRLNALSIWAKETGHYI